MTPPIQAPTLRKSSGYAQRYKGPLSVFLSLPAPFCSDSPLTDTDVIATCRACSRKPSCRGGNTGITKRQPRAKATSRRSSHPRYWTCSTGNDHNGEHPAVGETRTSPRFTGNINNVISYHRAPVQSARGSRAWPFPARPSRPGLHPAPVAAVPSDTCDPSHMARDSFPD
jgi:hypothetical protein